MSGKLGLSAMTGMVFSGGESAATMEAVTARQRRPGISLDFVLGGEKHINPFVWAACCYKNTIRAFIGCVKAHRDSQNVVVAQPDPAQLPLGHQPAAPMVTKILYVCNQLFRKPQQGQPLADPCRSNSPPIGQIPLRQAFRLHLGLELPCEDDRVAEGPCRSSEGEGSAGHCPLGLPRVSLAGECLLAIFS